MSFVEYSKAFPLNKYEPNPKATTVLITWHGMQSWVSSNGKSRSGGGLNKEIMLLDISRDECAFELVGSSQCSTRWKKNERVGGNLLYKKQYHATS